MLFNECNDCWEGCVGWEHSSLANVMSVYTSFLCRGNKHHSDHWSSSEMQLSAAAPHCYLWSPTTTDVVMMQSRDSRIWGWKHAHIMMAGQFYHHEQAWPCPYIGLTPGSSLQLNMAVINHIQISSTFQSQKPDKINWLYHNITAPLCFSPARTGAV